jgi:hypothetical protein
MSGFSLSFKIAKEKDEAITPPPTHFMWVAPDLINIATTYKAHGAIAFFKDRLHTTLGVIHQEQPVPQALVLYMPDVNLTHFNGSHCPSTQEPFASLLALEELTGYNIQLLKSMRDLTWLSAQEDLPYPTLFVWTGAAAPKLGSVNEWGVYVDVDAEGSRYKPIESANVAIEIGGLIFEEKVTAALYLTKKLHQMAVGTASLAARSMLYPEVVLVIGKMDGKTWRPYKKTLVDLMAANKLSGIMVVDCMYGRVERVVVPEEEVLEEEAEEVAGDGDDEEEEEEEEEEEYKPEPPPIRIFSDALNVQDVERLWALLERHPVAYNSYVFVGEWTFSSNEALAAFLRLEKEANGAQSSLVYEPMAWWTLHGGEGAYDINDNGNNINNIANVRLTVSPNAMLECFADFTEEATA